MTNNFSSSECSKTLRLKLRNNYSLDYFRALMKQVGIVKLIYCWCNHDFVVVVVFYGHLNICEWCGVSFAIPERS